MGRGLIFLFDRNPSHIVVSLSFHLSCPSIQLKLYVVMDIGCYYKIIQSVTSNSSDTGSFSRSYVRGMTPLTHTHHPSNFGCVSKQTHSCIRSTQSLQSTFQPKSSQNRIRFLIKLPSRRSSHDIRYYCQ
jgi:hypothetical protein